MKKLCLAIVLVLAMAGSVWAGCEHIYTTSEYPQLKKYRLTVANLYNDFLKIKSSDAFSTQGMASPDAQRWVKQCDAAHTVYAKTQLPPMHKQGLSRLKAMAAQYAALRKGNLLPANIHSIEEEIAINRKYIEEIYGLEVD